MKKRKSAYLLGFGLMLSPVNSFADQTLSLSPRPTDRLNCSLQADHFGQDQTSLTAEKYIRSCCQSLFDEAPAKPYYSDSRIGKVRLEAVVIPGGNFLCTRSTFFDSQEKILSRKIYAVAGTHTTLHDVQATAVQIDPTSSSRSRAVVLTGKGSVLFFPALLEGNFAPQTEITDLKKPLAEASGIAIDDTDQQLLAFFPKSGKISFIPLKTSSGHPVNSKNPQAKPLPAVDAVLQDVPSIADYATAANHLIVLTSAGALQAYRIDPVQGPVLVSTQSLADHHPRALSANLQANRIEVSVSGDMPIALSLPLN